MCCAFANHCIVVGELRTASSSLALAASGGGMNAYTHRGARQICPREETGGLRLREPGRDDRVVVWRCMSPAAAWVRVPLRLIMASTATIINRSVDPCNPCNPRTHPVEGPGPCSPRRSSWRSLVATQRGRLFNSPCVTPDGGCQGCDECRAGGATATNVLHVRACPTEFLRIV